jgi:predicted membrane protein
MKRWQIIIGISLLVLGLFALLEVLTGVDLWGLIFPLLLIGIGILLIFRPRVAGKQIQVETPILGDVRKKGAWQVAEHEIWLLVGTTRLDFTNAEFTDGEGQIKLFGFVNDLKIILPADVALRIYSSSFVSEFKAPEGKQERIMSELSYETPGYETAEKRVRIQALGFVSEIQIKPPLI